MRAGGAEILMTSLVQELASTDLSWNAVFVPEVDGADPQLVELARRSAAVFGWLPATPLYDPRLPFALLRRATELKVDVIHSHLSTANIASRAAAVIAGIPHVTTLHTMPGPGIEDTRLRASVDGWSAWLSRALVAPSEEIASAYSEAFRIPRRRLRVIPNAPRRFPAPADFDRAAFRRDIAGEGAQSIVVALARLQPEKGIDDLIDAVALLPADMSGVRVVVAGAGPEEDRLRSRVVAVGLAERIHLLGHRSDIGSLLAAADIFCLPSRHEGLPVSLLEAMQAGLPCLATRVGGIPTVVEDGRDGLLVDAGDPEDLALSLARLAADPEWAHRLGAEAQATVERRFNLEAVASAYAGVYRGLRGH